MKNISSIFLTTGLALFSILSFGEATRTQWQTAACFHFSLSVSDKNGKGNYTAKYVVTSADGKVFVAEKKSTDAPDTADVIFPDNFRDKSTNLKAWINCSYGENYSWEIYANGSLVESGAFVISRKKQK